jgi:hypothetical protein
VSLHLNYEADVAVVGVRHTREFVGGGEAVVPDEVRVNLTEARDEAAAAGVDLLTHLHDRASADPAPRHAIALPPDVLLGRAHAAQAIADARAEQADAAAVVPERPGLSGRPNARP